MERFSFASTNYAMGWFGTVASAICTSYASYLQQKSSHFKIPNLVELSSISRKLKKYGIVITYSRITDNKEYKFSFAVFTDASKRDTYGQLGIIGGLLVGGLKKNAILHTVSWQ